jgi:tryptophan-rich sensory protein
MRTGSAAGRRQAAFITVLIAMCLAYPFYTHFIPGHRTELAGNILSLAFALTVMARVWPESRLAALLVGLVAAWIVFATVLVFALARLNGW